MCSDVLLFKHFFSFAFYPSLHKEVSWLNKKIILLIIGIVLVGTIAVGIGTANAGVAAGPLQPIVQKIAQRFGISEQDVQSVFDEAKNERQAQKLARFEKRLTDAVNEGKITEAQKQAILTKNKDLSENRQQKRQEFESWLQQNGLEDVDLFGLHMKQFGGKGGGWHKW